MSVCDKNIGKYIRGVEIISFDEDSWKRDTERVASGEIKQARRRYLCKCEYCGCVKSIAWGDLSRSYNADREPAGCGCRVSEHISARMRRKNQYEYDSVAGCYIGRDTAGNKFTIDACDYAIVSQIYWSLDGRYFRGYIDKAHKGVLLHRYILFGVDNGNQSILVDHINGDTHDCRKANLRECTASQNQMNRKLNINSTSGATGVSYIAGSRKWRASMFVGGERVLCKLFDSFDDAVAARLDAEQKYFGEYSFAASRLS